MRHQLAKTPEIWRNSAACTRLGGAVGEHACRHMGYPAPVGRRTLRRVARAAQHGGVADVEGRTASGERHDVIDGQVARPMGGTLVAGAPVAVLTTPGAEHAGAEPLPGPGAVQGVVPAAVGLASVLGAAATNAAGDDTTDRAQLHGSGRSGAGGVGARLTPVTLDCGSFDIETSVREVDAEVYSPAVLHLGTSPPAPRLPASAGARRIHDRPPGRAIALLRGAEWLSPEISCVALLGTDTSRSAIHGKGS